MSIDDALLSPSSSRTAGAAADDIEALKQGLVGLLPELHARACRLCSNPTVAEDLVHDTVERTLRFASQYERGTNLRAWVSKILFSVFVTRYRRVRRDKVALRALAADPSAWTCPTPFPSPEATASLTHTTQSKLDALPRSFREAIILVDLDDLTYREAATALGVPVGTVMSRLHRGRRLLASQMGDAA